MANVITQSYRDWLKTEFDSRCRRSRNYSLRAFARDLDIPPPKLSQLMRGICGISGLKAKKIASKMNLTKEEKIIFVTMVEAEHSRSSLGKQRAQKKLERLKKNKDFSEISLEKFSLVSDWYNFAILELVDLIEFRPNINWISKRLSISTDEVSKSIQRLLEFGFLERDPIKGYRHPTQDLATPSEIPSRQMREYHSQVLQIAEKALHSVPIDERDFSSITMAIDSKKIAEAKIWLKEFRRSFCRDIQKSNSKDRVYSLCIQLFPLDKHERSDI